MIFAIEIHGMPILFVGDTYLAHTRYPDTIIRLTCKKRRDACVLQ